MLFGRIVNTVALYFCNFYVSSQNLTTKTKLSDILLLTKKWKWLFFDISAGDAKNSSQSLKVKFISVLDCYYVILLIKSSKPIKNKLQISLFFSQKHFFIF